MVLPCITEWPFKKAVLIDTSTSRYVYLFYHILANTGYYHCFYPANMTGEKYYLIILMSISLIPCKPE